MNNVFIINKDSFKEGSVSFTKLASMIHQLHEQICQIKNHPTGNKILVSDDIYGEWEWQNHPFHDIWKDDCQLDRDLKSIIQGWLMNYVDDDNVDDYAVGIDCCGLLTLDIRCQYKETDQVSGQNHSWYMFCMDKLMNGSGDSKSFIDDCIILFDNLSILERNYSTVSYIYPDFRKSILHHLSGLNLYLKEAQNYSQNRSDMLKRLSMLGCFHEEASPEGDVGRKSAFTFEVDNFKVCCEPHIKLCKSDNPGDSKYHFNRIYFHEGIKDIRNGKIIVGHIGKHL